VVVLSELGKTGGKAGKAWSALDMRRALKEMLANYKIPQEMKVVDSIPRNAMGKINKKQLVVQIWGENLEGAKKENGAVQVPNGSV
jgi:acyl-CoA synthetase (AMP-forming)/AMP-acid ligase II